MIAQIKRKKLTWAGHVMQRADNKWAIQVTKVATEGWARGWGRHLTRWRYEIMKLGGKGWIRTSQD